MVGQTSPRLAQKIWRGDIFQTSSSYKLQLFSLFSLFNSLSQHLEAKSTEELKRILDSCIKKRITTTTDNLHCKKRNSFGKAIKLYASGFQPSFIWGAERLNSSSRGQKMRPRNREHRFSIPSFKVFVTDHGQQHRHRNNSTSMAVLKFLHLECQRARTKKTANINPVLALSSILSLDLAMNTPWDYSDLKPTLSMSGQSCLIRVTYQESMFHFLSMLRLGNMLYHMHLESLQQYVSKDR